MTTDTRPLWRRALAGLLRAAPGARRTGYGWSCPPCKINAGHPGGLARHTRDTHHGTTPAGAWAGQITWRGPVPPGHTGERT